MVYKIADWLVHGGHQYEFFKTGHDFVCSHGSGKAPDPKCMGRPLNKNVKYVDQEFLNRDVFDIVMVRSPIKEPKYSKTRKGSNPPGIAVMQTTGPFKVPKWVRCIVWNSEWCMKRYKHQFSWAKNFYIPHGFDPNEFLDLGTDKNGRVLSAGNLYKQRDKFLDYSSWRWVANSLENKCDLIGHGNSDKECLGSFDLEQLVKTYNACSVFLNTTKHSAMPRTRGEAMMCGAPLVSTSNYGIDRYLVNGKNCIVANSKYDMLKSVKKVLNSKNLQEELSCASRATAVRFFSIDSYLQLWEEVFEAALK